MSTYCESNLISPRDLKRLSAKAAGIALSNPKLLHVDFRPENLLAVLVGTSIKITGIVDATNSLGGDPAFDLARLDEGIGLSPEFLCGYSSVHGKVDRRKESFLLYRLESAALLAWVYRCSANKNFRIQRLTSLLKKLEQSDV